MENREESVRNIKRMMGNAIRGGIEMKELYTRLSDMSPSIFLKERLKFLGREEEEHRMALQKLSYEIFGEHIEIPDKSGLPLPDIENLIKKDGRMPLEELIAVIEKAKTAKKETHEMYAKMSQFFEEGSPERRLLEYLTYVEEEHYYLLERKIIKLKKFGIV